MYLRGAAIRFNVRTRDAVKVRAVYARSFPEAASQSRAIIAEARVWPIVAPTGFRYRDDATGFASSVVNIRLAIRASLLPTRASAIMKRRAQEGRRPVFPNQSLSNFRSTDTRRRTGRLPPTATTLSFKGGLLIETPRYPRLRYDANRIRVGAR